MARFDVEEMKKLWGDGLSVNAISEQPGMPSVYLTRKTLTDQGLTLERRDPPRSNKKEVDEDEFRLLCETKTQKELIEHYGVTQKVISRICKDLKISPANRFDFNGCSPSKAQLQEDVSVMTMLQLTEKYGVGEKRIKSWLKSHDLKYKNKHGGSSFFDSEVFAKLSDPEWLRPEYEDKSSVAIGKDLGVDPSTVCNWLKKHGIDATWVKYRSGETLESQLADFVESLGVETIRNSRKIIPPKELDVYVPVVNVAFEFNGLYWHVEDMVGRSYHRDKTDACGEVGVQLIQVWEDDWLNRRPQVECMIRAKLGLVSGRVFARKCLVVQPDKGSVKEFLDENHIQGSVGLSFCMGLEFEGELVAVCGFRKRSEGVWELSRYASSLSVVGGFSRLVKAAEGLCGSGVFVSFADRGVSDGGLYSGNGWVLDAVLGPDYKYVSGGVREHKFNFRKGRFETDSELLFDPELSESELALLNGLTRVWDSGKLRFVKQF